MNTYILLMILWSNNTVSLTSTAQYDSLAECQRAGEDFRREETNKGFSATYQCNIQINNVAPNPALPNGN